MDRLNEYMKNLEFKKRAMGGLDEEDVLSRIKEIRDLAQRELAERDEQIRQLREGFETSQDAPQETTRLYQAPIQPFRDTNEQLNMRIRQIDTHPRPIDAHSDRCGEAREAWDREDWAWEAREAKEIAEDVKRRYDAKLQELETAMRVFQDVGQGLEEKMREEVRESLRAEEEQARAAMRARVEGEFEGSRREIERLKDEIASLRKQHREYSESLRARRENLNRQLSLIDRQLELDSEEPSLDFCKIDGKAFEPKDDFATRTDGLI